MKKKAIIAVGVGLMILLGAAATTFANNGVRLHGTGANYGSGMGRGFDMGRGMTRGDGKGMMGGKFDMGGGMGFGGGLGGDNMPAAQKTALTNNDYNAFLTAIKGTRMEGKVTQDQFNQMVINYKRHQAIDTALANNDYNAYLTATKISQDQFNKLVTEYKSRQALK